MKEISEVCDPTASPPIPTETVLCPVQELKSAGFEVHIGPGEADTALVELFNAGEIAAVISEDSDFLVYCVLNNMPVIFGYSRGWGKLVTVESLLRHPMFVGWTREMVCSMHSCVCLQHLCFAQLHFLTVSPSAGRAPVHPDRL